MENSRKTNIEQGTTRSRRESRKKRNFPLAARGESCRAQVGSVREEKLQSRDPREEPRVSFRGTKRGTQECLMEVPDTIHYRYSARAGDSARKEVVERERCNRVTIARQRDDKSRGRVTRLRTRGCFFSSTRMVVK